MISRILGAGACGVMAGMAVYMGAHLPLQGSVTEEQLAAVVGGACYVDATSDCPGEGVLYKCNQVHCSNWDSSEPCPDEGQTRDRRKQNKYNNASLGGPGHTAKKQEAEIHCTIRQTCLATCTYYLLGLGYYCDGSDADVNPRTPEIVNEDADECTE
jgi:hypothetical protein